MGKDSFEKSVAIFQLIGAMFLFMALYVFAFGVPTFDNLGKQAEFCYKEGGQFIQPSRKTHNVALCSFSYMHDEKTSIWGNYAMDKITNENWARAKNRTIGNYCLVCWDSGSCSIDVLTKIDNGTRRDTRC